MFNRDEHSLEAAREAAARADLGAWVARFLASPGSDNPELAEKLCDQLGWWIGPHRLPLNRLHRLAGPPDAPVLCPVDEEYWDDRVDDMKERIEDGWEPAPVIVSYRNNELVLEDGYHRAESLRRAGARHTWAIIGFETVEDRDRFETEKLTQHL